MDLGERRKLIKTWLSKWSCSFQWGFFSFSNGQDDISLKRINNILYWGTHTGSLRLQCSPRHNGKLILPSLFTNINAAIYMTTFKIPARVLVILFLILIYKKVVEINECPHYCKRLTCPSSHTVEVRIP